METAASPHCVTVMIVGEYENDRLLLTELSRKFGWRLFEVHNRREAIRCLRNNAVQVVLAERQAPQETWKRMLHDLRLISPSPQLIVTSRDADEYLWSEVLNLGGFDVLPRPLRQEEVERVVESAHRHCDLPGVAQAAKAS
jgi:DNA-binding response OmpR family regulator